MADNGDIMPIYSEVKHSSVQGTYTITKCTTQEIFDSAVNYSAEHDDTFVVSYPKCGTTWSLNIVDLLLRGNSTAQSLYETYTFIDHNGAEAVLSKPRPRLIKSHFYFEMIPWNPHAKYVFVARNPKDCVVSFYHHTVGYDQYYHFKAGKFSTYFQLFMKGKVDFGDYFRMVPDWWKKSKTHSNIYFILFEDMKKNPAEEITKLARFLGDDVYHDLVKNDQQRLNEIVQKTSFKHMQKQQDNYVCLHSSTTVCRV